MQYCYICDEDKEDECFFRDKSRKNGLQNKCRLCIAERQKNVRHKIREIIKQEKQKPCMDCKKEYPPYVMDFDHRENKSFGIAKFSSKSLKTVLKEITKCDLVCSNCHRIRTFTR